MPPSPAREGFIRRTALGFWLCGLAILGLARAWMKLERGHAAQPDAVSWLWLGGSIVLGAIGIALIVRELRRG